ncbi:hypothetical protein [Limnoglobus roseus]|uniref:Uncharacterized protein n=1 Tax=Limnoglobus roseus TaxID=2598579 RepID=A0A5C1AQZ2_9BACT|nr:hypothetical protein [Limnoglobus roseus]QEL19298.1 hypothetical protein PX52LOC_06363 [Limnoglobus roseus]
MTEKKPAVVMTASGRVKEHPFGADIREILDAIFNEHQRAGSDWDRPTKLFIGGDCIVASGLCDIAWEYGRFSQKKMDEMDEALDGWIAQRFGCKERISA